MLYIGFPFADSELKAFLLPGCRFDNHTNEKPFSGTQVQLQQLHFGVVYLDKRLNEHERRNHPG